MKSWMLTGDGFMFNDCTARFTPRPTVEQRRKKIIADADPALAEKNPRRKIEPTGENYPGKLPPSTGLIFTPRSAHTSNRHATETFSLVGPHAYTSAFAA